MKTYKIAYIGGDGIGPEVLEEGKKVVEAVAKGFKIDWVDYPFSCDYYLKNETALELIDALMESDINLPVIVISGETSEDLTSLLLSYGALDLIEKNDLSPAMLDRSIRYAIRRTQIDNHINNLIIENMQRTAIEQGA